MPRPRPRSQTNFTSSLSEPIFFCDIPVLSCTPMPHPAGTLRALLLRACSPSFLIPSSLGLACAATGCYAAGVWRTEDTPGLNLLLDTIVPVGAGCACFIAAGLLLRLAAHVFEERCRNPGQPTFGRKGLILATGSLLIVASCFYRSLFIASEGAALCRGTPSRFNAPVAGRSVATIGEIALVVQVAAYISATRSRLDVKGWAWADHAAFAYAPVVLAEVGREERWRWW